MPSSSRSNLTKYLIAALLRGAAASTSIVLWVVFLQKQYGFTLTEVVLLDIPFWVGKFLFELPTGVVADKYGRRLSLMIAAGMSSVSWLVFALSGSFWVLVATQFFGAIGATFQSGADEALLFETVKAGGREKEYAKISARMGVATTLSALVCGVGVGFLATVDLRLPVILSSLVYALAIVPIFLMKEQKLVLADGPGTSSRTDLSYTQIVRLAIDALRGSGVLRWAAAYMIILSCVAFYANIFLQPYTLTLGLGIAALGPVLVAVQLAGIGGSLSVARVEKLFGTRTLLIAVPLLLIPCMLVIGLVRLVPVLSVVALSSFLFTLTQPVLLAVIQGKISDEARATLLSIQSLLATVFLIVTERLGLIGDAWGVHTTYLVMAGLLAVFCLPLLWRGRKSLLV